MLSMLLSCVLGWFCYFACHRSVLGCGAFGVVVVRKGEEEKKGRPLSPQKLILKSHRYPGTNPNASWAGNSIDYPFTQSSKQTDFQSLTACLFC